MRAVQSNDRLRGMRKSAKSSAATGAGPSRASAQEAHAIPKLRMTPLREWWGPGRIERGRDSPVRSRGRIHPIGGALLPVRGGPGDGLAQNQGVGVLRSLL